MEKEQFIKTTDLCDRCRHDFKNCGCDGNCEVCTIGFVDEKGLLSCRCITIARNTPCPYFDELEVTA